MSRCFYLVDFENVNQNGLAGFNSLTENDTVVVFFTENAKKLDLSVISGCNKAEFHAFEIPAGKQSADIHLSSYAGRLVENNNVYIVSKDTDFDNVIKFWHKMGFANISRRTAIDSDVKKESTSTPVSTAKEVKSSSSKENVASKTKKSASRCILNNAIQCNLRDGGFDPNTIGKISSAIMTTIKTSRAKKDVLAAIADVVGSKKAHSVYNRVKKLL